MNYFIGGSESGSAVIGLVASHTYQTKPLIGRIGGCVNVSAAVIRQWVTLQPRRMEYPQENKHVINKINIYITIE